MTKILTGTALALVLALSATAQAQNNLSGVTVKTELEDAKDANALEFWPTIAEDAKTAILANAEPYLSDEGYQIDVRLKEISLSGSKILTGEGEFNRIEAWVYFRSSGGSDVPVEQQNLVVTAETLSAGVDEGGLVIPDVPMFYAALLDGLGRATVNELKELDPAATERRKDADDDS